MTKIDEFYDISDILSNFIAFHDKIQKLKISEKFMTRTSPIVSTLPEKCWILFLVVEHVSRPHKKTARAPHTGTGPLVWKNPALVEVIRRGKGGGELRELEESEIPTIR